MTTRAATAGTAPREERPPPQVKPPCATAEEQAASLVDGVPGFAVDVEFGNARGFFSGARVRPDLYSGRKAIAPLSFEASIEGARLLVRDRVTESGNGMTRELSFEALADSRLFDLVSRYVVVDASAQRRATIDGVEVAHRCANLYHQRPAGTVRVPVGASGWLVFRGEQHGMPSAGFEHVFYVRDARRIAGGNEWIVHHRIVCTLQAERLVLRGCNPRFEGPAPQWLDDRVPSWLKRRLFRIREERFPGFPVMVVGENDVATGHRVALLTEVKYHA